MVTRGREDLMTALAALIPIRIGAGSVRIWHPPACDAIDKLPLLQRERSGRIRVPPGRAVTGSGRSPGGTPLADVRRGTHPLGVVTVAG